MLNVLRALAVVAALAGGGYLLFDRLGTEQALRVLGIEVTAVASARESECDQARAAAGSESVVCLPDDEWRRILVERCAADESVGLAYVDADGRLAHIGRCPPELRRDILAAHGRELS